MVERGINQRELDDIWLRAGGEIRGVRRTGERYYLFRATGERSSAYNRRRKDAPARLVTFARRVLGRIDSNV